MRLILSKCLLLPFWNSRIPGDVLESILAYVRDAEVLRTYDFVDVIDRNTRTGWQVKSTRSSTPVTWKRAKIPNAQQLIEASRHDQTSLQELGDTIIAFCNEHARESIFKYELEELGYSRLILDNSGQVTYFERTLCTKNSSDIFDPHEFTWEWSVPKSTTKKEQLPALHGTRRKTGMKCWAWHGLGENQLHFSGESEWWPKDGSRNSFTLSLPPSDGKISFEGFIEILGRLDL